MSVRLALRQVEVTLGKFRLALDLDLQPGAVGVFGPSGSGKTTLLELIAGLRRPTQGRIELDGKVLAESPQGPSMPPHRRGIGYVPQDLALFPHLDVQQNILYGAVRDHQGEPSLDSLLTTLELKPLLARRIAGLSGGERQRVAIARALAARPRLLLLDEPLTGLDAELRQAALGYLRRLRERWAVPMIYVSHQAEEISELCEDVVVLRSGTVEARGRPEDIFETTGRPTYRLRTGLCRPGKAGQAEDA